MISLKTCFKIIVIIFYILSDEVCHADFLVVTTTKIIVFTDWEYHTEINVGLSSMKAAAYDPLKKVIYVSDKKENSIFRIKTDGDTAYKVGKPIVNKPDETILGLAFDYRHSTLYWTTKDGGFFYVLVPDNDITEPLKNQTMYKSSIQYPTSIAIDVENRYLYWVNFDLESNTSMIERSRLDVFHREVVVDSLGYPRFIMVDEEVNRLYWINWNFERSRSINYWNLGLNYCKHALIEKSENFRPSVIALGERNVYWIDRVSNELVKKPKDHDSRFYVWPTKVSKVILTEQPIGLFVLPNSDDAPFIQKGGM